MSDRTKFFGEQARAARAEGQARLDAEDAAKKAILQVDEAFTRAAAVYEPLFRKVSEELLAEDQGITPTISKASKVITAIDPQARTPEGGNVYLSLSFTAGKTSYELVYLGVQQPNVLGMLAWRRNNAETYFVGPQSKTAPSQVPQMAHIAEHHVNVAVDAMKTG